MGDIVYNTIYYAENNLDLTFTWSQLLDDSEEARLPIYFGDAQETILNKELFAPSPGIMWNDSAQSFLALTKLTINPKKTDVKALYFTEHADPKEPNNPFKRKGFTKVFMFVPARLETIEIFGLSDAKKQKFEEYLIPFNCLLSDVDLKNLQQSTLQEIKSTLHDASFVKTRKVEPALSFQPGEFKHKMLLATPDTFYRLTLHYKDEKTATKIVGFSFGNTK